MTIFTQDQLDRARALGTATLHEAAGRIGALPSAIKPLVPTMRLAGPAFPLRVPPLDNLSIHRALYRARPGDILVIDTGGGREGGYWGDILNEAAVAHGIGGLVIDGGVRDSSRLIEMPLPIFADRICIRGTLKGFDVPSQIAVPVRFGEVIVRPGDLIVGDADGVVALPAERIDEILAAGDAREADEHAKIARIRAGERTIDLYKFGE